MSVPAPSRERLLALLTLRSFKKQKVVLSSGKESDFYIDCKKTALLAEGHYLVGDLLFSAIRQHAPAALKAGLSPAVVEAIRNGRRPLFTASDEQAVYDFCREMHEEKSVGDETYGRAHGLLGTLGVVELTALMGYYTMVAMTLLAHEIPLPEGSAPALPSLGG